MRATTRRRHSPLPQPFLSGGRAAVALICLAALGISCTAGKPGGTTVPRAVATVGDTSQFAAGQCLTGVRPLGEPGPLPAVANCGTSGSDARILAVLRDTSARCPTGTGRYLSIPTGSPADQFLILCLELVGR